MSFKIKILLANIILMAVGMSVIGYLMLKNSFSVSLDTQIESGMDENRMIVASVQAELVDLLVNDSFESMSQLSDLGEDLADTIEGTGAAFCLLDHEQTVVYTNQEDFTFSSEVLNYLEKGTCNYKIEDLESCQVLTIASVIRVRDQVLYVVNQRDISGIYIENDRQIRYFRILLLIALVLCSAVILVITKWLTKPIEQLNQTAATIAAGDYSVRTNIHTNDEIGELAGSFDQMADAVEQHVEKLKNQARQQEDFVASFTHEIKTPMTAIIGYADMLRSKEMDQEQQFMTANYIFHEGKRLESMSLKLFDLIALDHTEIEKNRIYTTALQGEIEEMAEPLLKKDGQRLDCRLEPAVLLGDWNLLSTVFINLIDNARKASKTDSTIEVRGKIEPDIKDGQFYAIRVIDHGCGIPKEEVDKICEAFYMVDKSRARQQGGAGIGLATTRRIIETHQGQLLVESEQGRGTTMTILLPYMEENL